MTTAFRFDESLYTTQSGAAGEFPDCERAAIDELRSNHPELNHWGDLAIFLAWEAYSEAVLMLSWKEDLSRSEDFLNFLCWEQTRGTWPWGSAADGLSEAASVWKTGTDL